jgi:hypothetical protein
MLNFYFYWKPYQGANPLSADNIFIGEDANFEADIETQPIWPWIAEYLQDGPSFWSNHWVHHPFLLPEYSGDGEAYHRWFSHVFCREGGAANGRVVPLPQAIRDGISFVELLPWPTTAAKNILDEQLMATARATGHFRALAGLIFNSATQAGRTVFITKTAAEKLNEQLALDGVAQRLPEANQLDLKDGPWHQVFEAKKERCRVVIHYHPMAHFPAGGSQHLRAAIRELLLEGTNPKPSAQGNGGQQPPTPPTTAPGFPDQPFEPGSIAEYFYKQFPRDLAKFDMSKPNDVLAAATEPAVFFGGPDWENVRRDLAKVSKGNREKCVLSLFMVTITEQVIYTYHRTSYATWRSRTGFPKFGWSGYGFHHENPFILLQRPVDAGVVTAEQLCPLMPKFTRFYLQATEDYLKRHLPQIKMAKFLRGLMRDHAYVEASGPVALEFKRCLEAEVQQ